MNDEFVLSTGVEPTYYTRLPNIVRRIGLDVYARDLFWHYAVAVSGEMVLYQRYETLVKELGYVRQTIWRRRKELENLNLLASYTMPSSAERKRRVITVVRMQELWLISNRAVRLDRDLLRWEQRDVLREWLLGELGGLSPFDFGPVLRYLNDNGLLELDEIVLSTEGPEGLTKRLTNSKLVTQDNQGWLLRNTRAGYSGQPYNNKPYSINKPYSNNKPDFDDDDLQGLVRRDGSLRSVEARADLNVRADQQRPLCEADGEKMAEPAESADGALFEDVVGFGEPLLRLACWHKGDEMGLSRDWLPDWGDFLQPLDEVQLANVLTWLHYYSEVDLEMHEKIQSMSAVLRNNWGEDVGRRKGLTSRALGKIVGYVWYVRRVLGEEGYDG